MPLPFILGGLAVLSAAAGIGGHITAKETNEQADSINRDAQRIYDKAKNSLETSQNNAKVALERLENNKNNIANTSIKKFMDVFQHIRLDEINEDDFRKYGIDFDNNYLIEMRRMQGVYSSSLSTGIAGAAVGSAIAIAGSGMLPIISSTLSLAAGAMSFGGIGAATTLAGSALSMAASATPLAAIAAPVMLFTAFSATDKADENLEKARANYAEAEAAVAKMAASETVCNAIIKHADMFYDILTQLDSYFSPLTELFLKIVSARCEELGKDQLDPKVDLNVSELKIMASSHSILQSIISFFRVEFLDSEGHLSIQYEQMYDAETKKLPNYSNESNPDTIAAEANHMIEEASLIISELNTELMKKIEILKNVSSDKETYCEIKKVIEFVSNIVDNTSRASSIRYYGGSYSANNAFIEASKQSHEIEKASSVLNFVLELTNAKIRMFVSYAAYCEAEKKVDAIIDEINYIRKIFVENHVFPLLSSYQRLKGFTPYEITNYINSDKKYFADFSVISNGKNMIYFSIIPDNETDASYLASRVTAYCDELDSITDRLNSIENVSQKYKELLSSKSTSVFEKSSLRVQRMISEKSTILGTSDLHPINFSKSEKTLLSFSLKGYENIKEILTLEIIAKDGSINRNISNDINRVNNETINLSYRYSAISNVDYSQSTLKAKINTLPGNIIALISIALIVLLIVLGIGSTLPKFAFIMLLLLIAFGAIMGAINIKSRSHYNL